MDVRIFRLHLDPHFPEMVHDILLFPCFFFLFFFIFYFLRAMGPDYLEQ